MPAQRITVQKPDQKHHGAADRKLAARQRSEQARASRAGSQGQGRSYAFRRS